VQRRVLSQTGAYTLGPIRATGRGKVACSSIAPTTTARTATCAEASFTRERASPSRAAPSPSPWWSRSTARWAGRAIGIGKRADWPLRADVGDTPCMPEESATPDLVELTRRAIASGNDGDYDAMMSFFGPASSIDMTRLGLGSYSGPVAIRRFFENWIGASDEVEFLLDETLDVGNGVTLASVRQNARPTGTRGLLRFRYYAVYSWVERICLRVTHYRDVDEARAAAERLAKEP
jgi:hypothetical protein